MTKRDGIAGETAFTSREARACRQRSTAQVCRQRERQNSRTEIAHQLILKDENGTDASLFRTARRMKICQPDVAPLECHRVSSLANPSV